MTQQQVQQVAYHLSTIGSDEPHPFDPLTEDELKVAASIVRSVYPDLFFNTITLHEPKKSVMTEWLANKQAAALKPIRIADVVAIGRGSKVYDGLVDLELKKIIKWEVTQDVQPLVRFLLCLPSCPVVFSLQSLMKP
jgi:primary-amine oxidase